MKRIAVCLLIPFVAAVSPVLAAEAGPIDIGRRRELFVDGYLIEKLSGARLMLHRPRDEGKVLKFDKPWEGRFCGYATVIKDGDKYRMYYRGKPAAGKDGKNESVCYAESADGVRWTRPQFSLVPYGEHKRTNIVLAGDGAIAHNFSPYLDTRPGAPKSRRYKAVGGTAHTGLMAFVSPDGVHWKKLQDKPVIPKSYGALDSQNTVFWSHSERKYLCYLRTWTGGGFRGVRTISRTTSDDFLRWSKPVAMKFRHAGRAAPVEHLYTNQTHAYFRAPHIYVSTAARFMPGRRVLTASQAKALGVHPRYFGDTSDAVLMTSRGGDVYDRTHLSSFIRPGIGAGNWVSRSNYPALNVVRTGAGEMSVYTNQDYAQRSAHMRRYSLRIDGFSSLHAEYRGGSLLTKPIRFTGKRLSINFATSAAGSVQVEIRHAAGTPISGFKLDDCTPQIGNEIDRLVTWKSGPDVSALAGKPIRLRFTLKDADVYSFVFTD